MSAITILGLLPLLGVLALATLKPADGRNAKRVALFTSIITALVAIYIALGFEIDRPGLQFTEVREWIPAFGITYGVGVDGLSLVMILLAVILVPIVILAGWDEAESGRWSVKTFYMLILVLETMMIGVFAATDWRVWQWRADSSRSEIPAL